MLSSRYRMQPEDVEDLVSQTFLDWVRVRPGTEKNDDGLFLVIARRRVSDFWRRRKVELSLKAGPSSSPPDRGHLEAVLIERALLRFANGRTDRERKRLLELARGVMEGAPFAEACQATGIPRGSRGRYRETLRAFLKYLDRLRARARSPKH